MNTVFRFFVENWRFSILLTVLAVLMGVIGLGLLQRESFPPVNFASVQITTIYPGASPEEVNDQVTKVIEDELRGTAGLKDVKSISQSGRSTVNIRVDIDRPDANEIVNEIQRAATRAGAKLPPEVKDAPIVTELKAKEIPVIELAIVGENLNRSRDRQAEILKEILEDVRGVSSVRYSGYIERELQVLLNSQKLRSQSVGLVDVVSTLSQRLKNIPAGSLEGENENTLVRLIAKSSDIKAIESIVLRSNDSEMYTRVNQVGRVVDGSKRAGVLVRVNGEPATILVVTKKEESDAISVVDAVQAQILKARQSLPKDLKIVVYNDEGQRVKDRLKIVNFNAVAGLLAVLFILFFFLPGKAGLFSAASLPICALSTIAAMVYLNANFNIITMIAIVICLGNLVDNSVVVSEHYTALRKRGMAAQEAAVEAAQQFWIPFTASTITIVAAFIPMLVTQGVLGQFIRWIPIVVAIALVISLIESLTLLPARLQFLDFKADSASASEGWFSKVESGFGNLVGVSLRHRYLALLVFSGIIVSGFVVTAVFNRFELFPADGVEYYVARIDGPPQMPIQKTDKYIAEVSKKVMETLGADVVDTIVGRSGVQQVDFGDPLAKSGENVGFLLIRIKQEVYLGLNIEETLKKMRTIAKPDGLDLLSFENVAGGPPVGRPVTVTFRSTNYPEMKAEVEQFTSQLKAIKGVENVATDEVQTGNEFLFTPNNERVAFVGLNADQIGLNLRAALEGISVAKISERGIEYDVVVRYDAKDKNDISDIVNTGVVNSRGNLTPLRLLGDMKSSLAPPAIKSFDFKRSVTVTADVNPLTITSAQANAEARKILDKTLEGSSQVSTVFGGEEESTNESLRSLGIALVLSIFGIFLTLVFTFKSFSQPLLILSTIPLGLVGVFYSFVIDQRPLSFLAFIGIVGLSGVVINSAIILVDFIEELRRGDKVTPLSEILQKASSQRLRAVLATGLTTVVGLLPTAFGLGGTDPLLVPITLALSWGMIIGTVLSLLWIPTGYIILDDLKKLIFKRRKAI
jgi:multidrug efflux pump subunit AcrB